MSQTIKEVIEERIEKQKLKENCAVWTLRDAETLVRCELEMVEIAILPLEEAYLKRIKKLEEKAQVYDWLMEFHWVEWYVWWMFSSSRWPEFIRTDWKTPQEALQKLKEVLQGNK